MKMFKGLFPSSTLYDDMPSIYNTAYETGKMLTYAVIIGAKNAATSFSFINIPIFLMTFGSDAKSSPDTQVNIITFVSKAVGSMQLVRNIGEEISPLLCGKEYEEPCKALSRVASFVTQTWMLNQTAAAGVVKGTSYELLGASLPAVMAAEALAEATNPMFIALDEQYQGKEEFNSTKITEESSAGLLQGAWIGPYVYSSAQCSFLPVITGTLPNIYNAAFCAVLASKIDPSVVYNTTNALLGNINTENTLPGECQDDVCLDS